MADSEVPRRRVAVIGGGITGLAAALRVGELDPTAELTLYEAGDRLGGILSTQRHSGLLIEESADSFITSVPWAVDLCRRIGLEGELLTTDETRRQAFVVHRGKLVKVPQGFTLMAPTQLGPILRTPLLSPLGKLRLLAEWLIPRRRSTDDESLSTFVRRRFGREVFERLVQPLVGGIYTADPKRLSIDATMSRFKEMERTHGSVLRATLGKRGGVNEVDADDLATSGARYSTFVAPRDGMSSLVDRLAERLPAAAIRLNTPVREITRDESGGWLLHLHSTGPDDAPAVAHHDCVIVAAPAFHASTMLASLDAPLSQRLAEIPYASTAIVNLVYERADIGHPLDGFGFVVPIVEKRQILAASFASNKFAGRTPSDRALIRVFIGGACQPMLAELPDEEVYAIAADELRELLHTLSDPIERSIARWPRSMPQYHVGHQQLVEEIQRLARQHAGLALAGNAYHGVGIPHCIHSGELAAERVIS